MERREEEVEVADLLERLRAMLVQGIGAGKEVRAALEPVQIAGTRATARWCSASCCRTRSSTAARPSSWSSRGGMGTSCSRSPTTAADRGETASGTGLSIVRALVQDELQGSLALESNGSGLRAQVVFPA